MRDLDINAKLTFIVVGKRHHIRCVLPEPILHSGSHTLLIHRLFPVAGVNDKNSDKKSHNSLAGTIVDQQITHPTDLDFYLLSHAGLLGTSRPAHYSVSFSSWARSTPVDILIEISGPMRCMFPRTLPSSVH